MALQTHTHRDFLGRVIRVGDIVIVGKAAYQSKFLFATVTRFTKKRACYLLKNDYYVPPRTREFSVSPRNLLVITKQLEANFNGNVGGARELEQSRRD